MRAPSCRRAMIAPADLEDVLAPRQGLVAERQATSAPRSSETGTVRFEQAEGPLQAYERLVVVQHRPDGLVEVTQWVSLGLGLPGFSWLFTLPLRRHTARIGRLGRNPWWAPTARLPRRAAVVLATLCLLAIVVGYLSDLLAATMTYAAGDFHVARSGQGIALGVVEAGAVGALGLLHLADRRGRRPVLVGTLVASTLASAAGAIAPSLVVLTASQLVAASLVGASLVIIAVMAAEEMPPGSRAWAIGVIGMCLGFGSGLTLLALPLADLGRNGWRWLYALSLVGMPAVLAVVRGLPESRRWEDPNRAADQPIFEPLVVTPRRCLREHLTSTVRRRMLVLGAGCLLLAIFTSPASQFQNEFLHTERHLSATRISLLEQLSGTIGGLGTLIGARLADTWGRRPVAAAGVALGAAVTIMHYTSSGVALWAFNTLGSVISYGVVPVLAVYGAELFPTSLRARAGGLLTVLAACGGVVGLVAGGALSSAFGTIAPALAILAVAPLAVVVVILVAYPETAGATLEELNPGDLVAPM